ncbi:hypothetical protein [Pleomorphomonas sp. T1.2MG-36]|uniref:hypothetical protein n=1 Tax=Pleomorphomonas sp. T1.2MG-36 TaxID=3041167 RepID=UPI0025409910|nr:hypothetical protein [Pleomorphomonas sp. T1.2MG-36]
MVRKAFFAYPAAPADLASTIKAACERTQGKALDVLVTGWPQMEVFGDSIAKQVRSSIDASDVLIADITVPNRNVYYEIGYAVGQGKPVAPVLNVSFQDATKYIQLDGFFDTIAYQTYENSNQLLDIFRKLPSTKLVEL